MKLVKTVRVGAQEVDVYVDNRACTLHTLMNGIEYFMLNNKAISYSRGKEKQVVEDVVQAVEDCLSIILYPEYEDSYDCYWDAKLGVLIEHRTGLFVDDHLLVAKDFAGSGYVYKEEGFTVYERTDVPNKEANMIPTSVRSFEDLAYVNKKLVDRDRVRAKAFVKVNASLAVLAIILLGIALL